MHAFGSENTRCAGCSVTDAVCVELFSNPVLLCICARAGRKFIWPYGVVCISVRRNAERTHARRYRVSDQSDWIADGRCMAAGTCTGCTLCALRYDILI